MIYLLMERTVYLSSIGEYSANEVFGYTEDEETASKWVKETEGDYLQQRQYRIIRRVG